MAPPPGQPPELVADIIGEILLLLPPTDPATLVRASLVCKLWRRLLTDPSFHRRYCAIHDTPLLGFLYDHYTYGAVSVPRFVSILRRRSSPFPQPTLGYRDCSVLDCRHGRVLFDVLGYTLVKLVVWDPTTGGHHELPEPPISRSLYSAAVMCAATVSGECDHLDCHGDPFLVVLMALDVTESVMQAHVYSSETGAWNLSAHRDVRLHVARKPASTLTDDNIYFALDSAIITTLLRYDMYKNCLTTIDAPALHAYEEGGGFATLAMEDGSLGFVHIRDACLHLWSRNDVDTEVDAGWELWRSFELGAYIPNPCSQVCVVGSAEDAGFIFLSTDLGLFAVGLGSGWMHKVNEPGHYDAVFPFVSFYTRLG